MALVTAYERRFGSNTATRGARDALAAYVAWHRAHGQSFPAIDSFLKAAPDHASVGGGTIEIDREELRRYSAIDFTGFARHRYSIRQYTGEPVPEATTPRQRPTAPTACG